MTSETEENSWLQIQSKIAQELIFSGLFDENLEQAEGAVYDGAMAYTWWDDFIDMNGTKAQQREAMAYRIAERIILGKEPYQSGDYPRPTPPQKKLIGELKQKILVACRSL